MRKDLSDFEAYFERRKLLSPGVWRDLLDSIAQSEGEYIQERKDFEKALAEAGVSEKAEPEAILKRPGILEALMEEECPYWKIYPEDYRAPMARSVRILMRIPWQNGPARRMFRTQETGAHCTQVGWLLEEVLDLWKFEIPFCEIVPEYLRNRKFFEVERTYITDCVLGRSFVCWLTDALDRKDELVRKMVRDAVYEANGALSQAVIFACFRTEDPECREWMRDLLLAAKNQEGLRQSICEKMDQGTFESFRFMVRVVQENGLIWFSSVLRAFGTWIGMEVDPEETAKWRRLFGEFADILERGGELTEKEAKSPLAHFFSLTILAAQEVRTAVSLAQRLLEDSETEFPVKSAAAYFLAEADAGIPVCWTLEMLGKFHESPVIASLLLKLLPRFSYAMRTDALENDFAESRTLYWKLRELLEFFPEKEKTAVHPVFPWLTLTISRQDIFWKMLECAQFLWTAEEIDDLLLLTGRMSAFLREFFVRYVLHFHPLMPRDLGEKSKRERHWLWEETLERHRTFPRTPKQREALFAMLRDRSVSVREWAAETIRLFEDLTESEILQLEDLLRLKAVKVRIAVLDALRRNGTAKASAKRLRESGNFEKMRAAKELDPVGETVDETADGAEGESVGGSISGTAKWMLENGLGLFVPGRRYWQPPNELSEFDPEFRPDVFLPKCLERAKELLRKLNALLWENRDLEFWYAEDDERGGRTRTLMEYADQRNFWRLCTNPRSAEHTVPELWDSFFAAETFTLLEILSAQTLLALQNVSPKERKRLALFYGPGSQGWLDGVGENSDKKTRKTSRKAGVSDPASNAELNSASNSALSQENGPLLRHSRFFSEILARQFFRMEDREAVLLKIFRAFLSFPAEILNAKIPEDPEDRWSSALMESEGIRFWFSFFSDLPMTEERFQCARKLTELWNDSRLGIELVLDLPLLAYAFETGLIPEEEVCRFLMENDIWGPMNWFKVREMPPRFRKLLDRFTQRLAEFEFGRTEEETPVTKKLKVMKSLSGVRFMVRTLHALGNYRLMRGDLTWENSAPAIFCRLLQISEPAPGETAEELRAALREFPIRNESQRILETAMYRPAWLPIAAEYFGKPELPMAVWYFRAHMGTEADAETETQTARYSQVALSDFQDGAFDGEWFRSAFEAVGEEFFQKIYDSAKYITVGANHRRAQIYADAALGRLAEECVLEKIRGPRNPDYVRALGILPVSEESEIRKRQLLERYAELQRFLKASRQYGVQRQASEKRAVEIAIGNLARTAGFEDAERFVWRMEKEQFMELAHWQTPRKIGEFEVSLAIDADGKPSMRVGAGGKVRKSVPAALKKDPAALELAAVVKSLRDQRSRAVRTLETEMERGSLFPVDELRSLAEHPILGPLVHRLVWISGDGERMEFPENLWTKIGAFEPDTNVGGCGNFRIAHPLDLLESGHWSDFQKRTLEKRIIQPFRQIFRELYVLTEDERRAGTESFRYAGHQVQPRKAAAVLKSRGWTVDMEEGLQKVFHREGFIAKIRSEFNWFTPADIEMPTLESIYFEDRKSGKSLHFEKIPPRYFSEVMRDLDLMVSAAHAGGVDPEASHSTVEMRTALLQTFLPLFALENVRVEKTHAFICGTFGEYTVHLGSGVCHKKAVGMLPIVPVHSAHRGRIFLPFADEDPKTAEILSKVLLLAEDQKIKDPKILEMVR